MGLAKRNWSGAWSACVVPTLVGLWLVMAVPAQAINDIWKLDPDHTDIRFTWDHLGVSQQSGTVTEVTGSLKFSPTNPGNGQVEITAQVASLSTGVAALDQILKSPDYFDAGRHPRMTFKSREIHQTGPKTGQVIGDLTIRDTTKPVSLDVTWNYTGEHPLAPFNPAFRGQWVSGFTARATIKRSDWGIDRSAPLVSDAIELEINAEFLTLK